MPAILLPSPRPPNAARLFVDEASQYHLLDEMPVASLPMTVSAYTYNDELGTDCVVGFGKSDDAGGQYYLLYTAGATARAGHKNDSGTTGSAIAVGNMSLNTWHHMAAVFESDGSRKAYRDGGNVGSNTIDLSGDVTTVDRVAIGGWYRNGGVAMQYSGMITHVGVWDCILPAAEIWQLGHGLRPDQLSHRLANLKLYKLSRGLVNGPGDFGPLMTNVNGTVIAGPGPHTIYSIPPRIIVMAPGGGSIGLADSLGLTDQVIHAVDTKRLVTDDLGLSGDQQRTLDVVRTIVDSLGLGDDQQRAATLLRSITDNLGLFAYAPFPYRKVAAIFARSVSDSLGLADVVEGPIQLVYLIAHAVRVLSDSLGLSDDQQRVLAAVRTLTDSLGLSDDVAAALAAAVATILALDSLGLSDDAQRTITALRTLPDDLGITDVAQRVATLLRIVTTDLGLSDASQRTSTVVRLLADNLGLSDDVTANLNAAIETILILDSIGLSDSVLRIAAVERQVSDDLGLADQVARSLTALRSIADDLGLTDSLTVEELEPGLDTILVLDSLGLTDTVVRIAAQARAVIDSFGLTDAVSRSGVLERAMSDSLGLSDLLAANTQFVRAFSDYVGAADDFNRTFSALRLLTDDLGAADSLHRILTSLRLISDQIGLDDSTSFDGIFIWQLLVADTLGLTDDLSLSRLAAVLELVVKDTLGLSDAAVVFNAIVEIIQYEARIVLEKRVELGIVLEKSAELELMRPHR